MLLFPKGQVQHHVLCGPLALAGDALKARTVRVLDVKGASLPPGARGAEELSLANHPRPPDPGSETQLLSAGQVILYCHPHALSLRGALEREGRRIGGAQVPMRSHPPFPGRGAGRPGLSPEQMPSRGSGFPDLCGPRPEQVYGGHHGSQCHNHQHPPRPMLPPSVSHRAAHQIPVATHTQRLS